MLQKHYNNMALKIGQLERYTDRQQEVFNDLID